jgi:hypothetical protein
MSQPIRGILLDFISFEPDLENWDLLIFPAYFIEFVKIEDIFA